MITQRPLCLLSKILKATFLCYFVSLLLSYPVEGDEKDEVIKKLIQRVDKLEKRLARYESGDRNHQLENRVQALEKRLVKKEKSDTERKKELDSLIEEFNTFDEREKNEGAEKPSGLLKDIKFSGFVESSYNYNFNRPTKKGNRINDFRVFDTEADSFRLDLAKIVLEKEVTETAPAGFRLDLDYGNIPEVIGSSGLGDPSDEFDLQQAYITWRAPIGKGLDLSFGKWVTFHGAEVIESVDNYNYSRSFLFGFAIPFTHTGLKADYVFNDFFDASFYVVNGWDNVTDNNEDKSYGVRFGWNFSENFALTTNFMYGAEQDDNDSDKRGLFDVVATIKPAKKLTLLLNYDYGTEMNVPGIGVSGQDKDAQWGGFSAVARYDLNDQLSFALRGEYFNDDDGARTGFDQDLKEFTFTTDIKITEALLLRLEYRHDWSSERTFDDGQENSQDTVGVDVIYSF